ncbi:MAG: ethanolamine utilization protein EutJ [Tissierellia bacterium]|nr:ethanolamine utilization protein EutJ [Tissierellia bacterium]
MNLQKVNKEIRGVEKSINKPNQLQKDEKVYVGVDLGTAYMVMVVLGENYRPLACEMEFAQVIKDGLVVDFIGAQQILRRMKASIEEKLGISINHAAIAVPPGTSEADSKTHYYVVEGAGISVSTILDEPTAANEVLNIENGVIVDIGGGTTGISIFKNSEVIYVYDEPTGGTHLSLVLAGNYKISFEEAEEKKKSRKKDPSIFPVVRPVLEKMATIVKNQIKNQEVEVIYLVGGTCMIEGIEEVFETICGVKVVKPKNPLLVTPVGIAKSDGR